MSPRAWCGPVLAFIVLGVPALACGGTILSEPGDAGPGDASVAEVGATGSATSTTTAPASGTSSPTSTPTGTGSNQGGFGPFPCASVPVMYNQCAPNLGPDAGPAPPGCSYWAVVGDPPQALTPVWNESVSPGCQLELVSPTTDGGVVCTHIACECTDGGWYPEPWSNPWLSGCFQ